VKGSTSAAGAEWGVKNYSAWRVVPAQRLELEEPFLVACHPFSADCAFAPLKIRSNLAPADARRWPALGSLRGITFGAWFGLAAQLGGWNGVAQMPMLLHVAVGTKGHEIPTRHSLAGFFCSSGDNTICDRVEDFIPRKLQQSIHPDSPATADCQLRKLLQAGSSLCTWLGLAAHSGGWNSVTQLPMLFHLAVSTYGD
jgi:hypothetical protein